MTDKALDLLHDDVVDGPWRSHRAGQKHNNRRGFFLQVEGASIDKQDHVEAPCQQIGETIAFDRAIKVGLDFAKRHPDTLIIITADDAHTSQIVPVPGNEALGRPGNLSTLLTKGDQSLMTINYGTRPHGQSQDHTGSQVRIAAQGPQAASVVGVTTRPISSTRWRARSDSSSRDGRHPRAGSARPDSTTKATTDTKCPGHLRGPAGESRSRQFLTIG